VTPPFEYLDHPADAYLRGIGKTVEEAFVEAARGLFQLMVDLDRVSPTDRLEVSLREPTLELLLMAWLGRLLAETDLSGLVLARFCVELAEEDGGVRLSGQAWGEPLDPIRHGPRTEVKGVTFAGLAVEHEDGRWIAQCVVDV